MKFLPCLLIDMKSKCSLYAASKMLSTEMLSSKDEDLNSKLRPIETSSTLNSLEGISPYLSKSTWLCIAPVVYVTLKRIFFQLYKMELIDLNGGIKGKAFPSSSTPYEIELAEAAAMAQARMANNPVAAFNEADLVLSTDADILASGAKIFNQQCAVCHKTDGGGSIGPNLTDDYWIHGGDIKSIYVTVKEGVPDKGMISWKAMLSPAQMRDVSNYIKSLKGTNPAGAKAAQGELYEGE